MCKRDLLAFLEEYKEPVDATDRCVLGVGAGVDRGAGEAVSRLGWLAWPPLGGAFPGVAAAIEPCVVCRSARGRG